MIHSPSIGITVCSEEGIEIFSLMDKTEIIFLSFSEEALHEAQSWLQKKYPHGKFRKEHSQPLCRYFKEYIHGKRKDFPYPRNSPFLKKGTTFQKKVWDQISNKPYYSQGAIISLRG